MADDAARRDVNKTPSLLAIQEGNSELRSVRVDQFGRLVVAGAGAEPTATSLKVADGADVTRLLTVDANGRIGINNHPANLTDTQLRASPVPVSGPLTDVQLRATPVPITGTVSGPLTDTQLRASDVGVVLPTLRTRFDYGTRTDSKPVYIGKAPQSTPDSGSWTILRFTYDASDRPTDIQVLIGAWTDRTTLGWV